MSLALEQQADMTSIEPHPTPPPPPPPFQFRLRTLLLLCVVLGSSLAVFGAWGIVVFGLVVGLAIYVHEAESLRPLMNFVVIVLLVGGLISLWLQMPRVGSHEPSPRGKCYWNLCQIAEALQAYHKVNGCFPPAYIADADGKPMHSWRTLILPYLDEKDAYNKAYDFTEPWDSVKNKDLLYCIPPRFACGCDHALNSPEEFQTSYVAVVGSNAAWTGVKPRKLTDFGKDASRTIMLVEVTNSTILWSEPRDLSLDSLAAREANLPDVIVSSNHRPPNNFFITYPPLCEANVVMADGSVRCLRLEGVSTEDLKEILQVGACPKEAFHTYDAAYQMRHLNWPNIAALAVWLASVGTLLIGAVLGRKPRSVSPVPPPAK